jgi:hypothetical protein
MIVPQPLPPLPYLQPEMHDLVARYDSLREREVAAREEEGRARRAIRPAEEADRRAQAEAIRDGGTARDAGWQHLEAAQEALADAEAEHQAVVALLRQMRAEWVASVRDHLCDLLDRAAAEEAREADAYSRAIDELFARRSPYLVAHVWRNVLRRFAESDDADELRWPGDDRAISGAIRYATPTGHDATIEAATLAAVLKADVSRHEPPAKRKRTVDDAILTRDMARATGDERARLAPVAE